jgi:nucleoside-diphosphate-sugar epimerase
MIEGQKIVITGGAGFMGTHLTFHLAPQNQVALLDIDVQSNSVNYTDLPRHPNVRLVQGDVCDPEFVRGELAGCDIIVHLAALLGVQKVVNNARRTMDTIVLGTRNVLEASCQNGPVKRLINVSTSEIFGNTTAGGDAAPASISAANDPRMSYAAAKLLSEHMAWSYYRDLGVKVVNVRPFNVFGPYRKTSNAVGVFIVRALHGEDLLIHGQGGQLRSWCYIDDFCDGMLACLDRDAAVGEDFNLGNSLTTCTVHDLAKRIVRLADSSSNVRFVEHPFSDINVRAPSGDKAARLLDFHPHCDIDESLQQTIQWYRDHLDDFHDWL